MRSLSAALVVVVAALTATSAAAATSTIVTSSSGGGASFASGGSGADATASASTASPAPVTTASGLAGTGTPGVGQSTILYASRSAAAPSLAAGVRAQPTVIAVGSADSPVGHPTQGASGSGVSGVASDQSIVLTARHGAPASRPTVTQLSSGGPFVAASGAAGAAVAARAPAYPRLVPSLASMTGRGVGQVRRLVAAAPAPVIAVSVPVVGVYLSNGTGLGHPGQKPATSLAEPMGPSGLPATTIVPLGAGPVEPPGMTALYWIAPFSSSRGGGIPPFLELSAMLVAMTLLAWMPWRRRPWDLSVLRGESALLSSRLERPG